jgi:2-hydroxychromene-2-carboxylate isomerase
MRVESILLASRGEDLSMPGDHVDFWFTMGSTYSYLTVMRLVELERTSGIRFTWRPFHLLTILQEMKHIPFADNQRKPHICGATSNGMPQCTV